jgi:hypothetical protein
LGDCFDCIDGRKVGGLDTFVGIDKRLESEKGPPNAEQGSKMLLFELSRADFQERSGMAA